MIKAISSIASSLAARAIEGNLAKGGKLEFATPLEEQKMLDLTGKSILVCGGSGHIGSAIVQTLVQCGADVLYTYHRHPRPDLPGHGIRLDVTDPESVQGLPGRVREFTGGLEGWVYCTGINKPNPFDKIPPDDWDTILDVNLTGAWRVARAVLPLVRDGGSICFIGSVSGFIGGKTTTHYCASKLGLVGLMQNLALFAASRKIRSNMVAPGYIASPLAEAGSQSQAVRDTIAGIPLGRLGTPAEVAGPVAFLMDERLSGYITGTVIHCNGGLAW